MTAYGRKSGARSEWRPGNRGNLRVRPGELSVYCWCQRDVVVVPDRDIFEGRTKSCGRQQCHGPCEVSKR